MTTDERYDDFVYPVAVQLFPTAGVVPSGQLIGRDDDIARLVDGLTSEQHQILIGTRGSGKTSVVQAALAQLDPARWRHLRVDLSIDLYRTGSVAGFLDGLESQIHPDVEREPSPPGPSKRPEEQARLKRAIDEIQRGAEAVDRRVVLFLDEIHEMVTAGLMRKPEQLLETLRDAIDAAPRITGLFTASVDHAVHKVSRTKDQPLHGFATLSTLPAIPAAAWRSGLSERFGAAGCELEDAAAEHLLRVSRGHPRSTMLIAQWTYVCAWERAERQITPALVDDGVRHAMVAEARAHEAELARVRTLSKHALAVTRQVVEGASPYKPLPPAVARQTLRGLEVAGIVTHPRSGAWQVVNPLFGRYLSEPVTNWAEPVPDEDAVVQRGVEPAAAEVESPDPQTPDVEPSNGRSPQVTSNGGPPPPAAPVEPPEPIEAPVVEAPVAEAPVAEAPVAEVEPEPEPVAETQPEPQPAPEPATQPEPEPQPAPIAEPEPVAETQPEPQPAPEPGTQPEPEPQPAPIAEPELVQPSPVAVPSMAAFHLSDLVLHRPSAEEADDVATRVAQTLARRRNGSPGTNGHQRRSRRDAERLGQATRRVVRRYPDWYWHLEVDDKPVGGLVLQQPQKLVGSLAPGGIDPVARLGLAVLVAGLSAGVLIFLLISRAWTWSSGVGDLFLAAFVGCLALALVAAGRGIGRARASWCARQRGGMVLTGWWTRDVPAPVIFGALAEAMPGTFLATSANTAEQLETYGSTGFWTGRGRLVTGVLDPHGEPPVRPEPPRASRDRSS